MQCLSRSGANLAWKTKFSADAAQDLDRILEHLVTSYCAFGEDGATAYERAAARIAEVQVDADRIAAAPYRGVLRNEILVGARSLTIGRAVYWFNLDSEQEIVRILAIFYDGEDRTQAMLQLAFGADGSDKA